MSTSSPTIPHDASAANDAIASYILATTAKQRIPSYIFYLHQTNATDDNKEKVMPLSSPH